MDFTINVHVAGLDKLAEAIEKLAGQREENAVAPIAPTEKTAVPVSSAPVSAPAPTATAPVSTATPTPAMETTPAPVAPAASTYTVDELARAAAPLMDNATGMQTLCNLLAQFGVQSLQQLPQDKYGAFATELRGLGADI